MICTTLTIVDTNGRAVVTGGAPQDFGVSEKRTKREIDIPWDVAWICLIK